MKVRNISNVETEIPGTQPGFVFLFKPGQVIDIPDGMSGFVLSNPNLEFVDGIPEHLKPKEEKVEEPKIEPEKKEEKENPEINLSNGEKIADDREFVNQERFDRVDVVKNSRKIQCEHCGKELNSREEKFDDRIRKMHSSRMHPAEYEAMKKEGINSLQEND